MERQRRRDLGVNHAMRLRGPSSASLLAMTLVAESRAPRLSRRAMRIPRTNNVYSQVIAPDGLRPVLAAVERALGPGNASLYRSRAGGAEVLRIRSDTADFESLPLPGGIEHLLNGAVAGSSDDVAGFARG